MIIPALNNIVAVIDERIQTAFNAEQALIKPWWLASVGPFRLSWPDSQSPVPVSSVRGSDTENEVSISSDRASIAP